MKKILCLVLAIITLLFCLAGCDKEDNKEIVLTDKDIHTDYAGVYLTLSSVETSGEHKILNAVWHNETNQEIVYGNAYQIEIFEDNEWKSVLKGELVVTSIAHILKAKNSREKTYSTEVFDLSKEGTYRLISDFSLSNGDDAIYRTWVEFEIKESANIKSYSVTVEDDEFLYEKLNDKYKEGEPVVVKTEILLDASITVYVNDESIGMGKAIETNGEYTHWEYYFTMPSEDVVIRLEITDGFGVADRDPYYATAYAGWTGGGDIYSDALNSDKLSENQGVEHLPIHRFDTLSELEAFKNNHGSMSWDEIPSLDEAIQTVCPYGFFDNNSLFIIYVPANSSSYRFGVDTVYINSGALDVYIRQTNNPQGGDEAMAGWFILLPIQKKQVESCVAFDAHIQPTDIFHPITPSNGRLYTYTDSDNQYKPAFILYEDGAFQLVMPPWSSIIPIGSYTEENGKLTLVTHSGDQIYCFDAVGDTYVFDAEASSSAVWFSGVPDGSVFE